MTVDNGLAMSWEEWATLDAVALSALVRDGEIAVSDVVRQVSAGVALLNPRVEAVIEVFDDVLHRPDMDRPSREGALYGVPIFLKDEGSGLHGRLQESGTALLAGHRATHTDPFVDNLLSAGLIPLGRATSSELGMSFDTVTTYRGERKITRNPWHLDRTAGGSSGGSAASVAAGLIPVAGASDGGGSTRIPASFCGLVGLKATRGRVPPPTSRNEFMRRISVEGVLTRSVRDTAAIYDYISQVPNGGTFIRLEEPTGSYLDGIARPPSKLRVALSTSDWGREGAADHEVVAHVQMVATLLEELGHHVEVLKSDHAICDWDEMWLAYKTEWITLCAQFVTIAEERGIKASDLDEYLSPMLQAHVAAAVKYDKFDLWRMMKANNLVTRQFGAFMERFDVLLTPTMPIRTPHADGQYSTWRDDDLSTWVSRKIDACRYTMPGNETGLPAISLPGGLDSDGLPIGAQLYGNFGREDLLLQLAAQVERARPTWFCARPPVHVSRADAVTDALRATGSTAAGGPNER